MRKYFLLFFIATTIQAAVIYPIQETKWQKVVRCNINVFCYFKTDFGATITTINGSDQLSNSRSVINTNFSNLNTDLVATIATTSMKGVTTMQNLISIGTITTGVWNGTTIAIANGGTNATSFANNTLVFFDGTRFVATSSTGRLFSGSFYATSTSQSSIFLGKTGFGTTTPFITGGIVASSTILSYEGTEATSTSQTIDFSNSNQSLVRIGVSAITMTFTNVIPGMTKRVIVCNGLAGTAGTITWPSSILWSGSSVPTQTTTANKCDVWSFVVSKATSTQVIFGAASTNF